MRNPAASPPPFPLTGQLFSVRTRPCCIVAISWPAQIPWQHFAFHLHTKKDFAQKAVEQSLNNAWNNCTAQERVCGREGERKRERGGGSCCGSCRAGALLPACLVTARLCSAVPWWAIKRGWWGLSSCTVAQLGLFWASSVAGICAWVEECSTPYRQVPFDGCVVTLSTSVWQPI